MSYVSARYDHKRKVHWLSLKHDAMHNNPGTPDPTIIDSVNAYRVAACGQVIQCVGILDNYDADYWGVDNQPAYATRYRFHVTCGSCKRAM